MKNLITIRKGVWLAAAVLGPLSAGAADASTLFLDSWGVSYGNWGNSSFTGEGLNYVVEDWTGGGDGYLDPGWGGDQYDAEAAYMASDGEFLYVAVVTGFPIGGRWSGSDFFAAGDIGIDVNGDKQNAHDYDYAIDVSASGRLRGGDLTWQDPSIGGNPAWNHVSDPLRVTSWTTSTNTQFSYSSWQGRYAIESIIDLDDLGPNAESFSLHWTMGCGNDEIEMDFRPEAPTDPVPEPASLLLFGSGLGMAGLMKRRRQKKNVSE